MREMSWRQMASWMVFDELSPFSDVRGDFHAASICAMVGNMALIRMGAKHRFDVEDLMLEFGDRKRLPKLPVPKATWQDLKRLGRMIAASDPVKQKKKRRR